AHTRRPGRFASKAPRHKPATGRPGCRRHGCSVDTGERDKEDPMAQTRAATFDHFDQRVAEAMIKGNNETTPGLPGFLGAKFTAFEPGRLVAVAEVRRDFLPPIGNIHGGIMAGLVDHLLGCVLYPLMPRGAWAATTEFKLNYLAPVKEGTLTAEST